MNDNISGNLDRDLEAPMQSVVQDIVRELPDESPSMAWRSGLNDQLRAIADRRTRRKKLFTWTLSPALGLGAACACYVMFNASRPSAVAPTNVASIVVSEHAQAVNFAQVSWADRRSVESAEVSARSSQSVDWSEVDTESL